jgi:hypothetical protein
MIYIHDLLPRLAGQSNDDDDEWFIDGAFPHLDTL